MSSVGRSHAGGGHRRATTSDGRRQPAARTRRRLPRLRPRLVAALVAVAALAAGGWLWLRTSPLVSIQRVTIAGVSGPDASQIRSALTNAARGMTTLDVKLSALRTAVAPYPVVKHLRVSTSFPHGIRIDVAEQVPVAQVSVGGRQITAVSSDGTLLRDAVTSGPLPSIALTIPPGGSRLTGTSLAEVHLLAAAPYALLAKVSEVSSDATHGLVAQLRNGPSVYFGAATELAAKWSAAVDSLATSSSAGAAYIDVTDPQRPAAGAGAGAASAAAGASSGAAGASSGAISAASTGASQSTAGAGGSAATPPAAGAAGG